MPVPVPISTTTVPISTTTVPISTTTVLISTTTVLISTTVSTTTTTTTTTAHPVGLVAPLVVLWRLHVLLLLLLCLDAVRLWRLLRTGGKHRMWPQGLVAAVSPPLRRQEPLGRRPVPLPVSVLLHRVAH